MKVIRLSYYDAKIQMAVWNMVDMDNDNEDNDDKFANEHFLLYHIFLLGFVKIGCGNPT